MMKNICTILCIILSSCATSQQITAQKSSFRISESVIYVSKQEPELVRKAAELLQQDILAVIGKKIPIISEGVEKHAGILAIGTIQHSPFLQKLSKANKFDASEIEDWEGFLVQSIRNPEKGIKHVLVIAGKDRRGCAYGVFELSRQMGVSPWYWWADVPTQKKAEIYITDQIVHADAPRVRYRGIFINDEAPALSNWSKEKFGGFNHRFYEKVFELILRLKGNYIWPAMWGNAFYADDSLNRAMADRYGIVIGTSHHEPLMRAHDEWRRFGSGAWNYEENPDKLRAFWRTGMARATNEKIVSIGMRGDGDKPMSRETATTLLEAIVADQRKIIAEVTGKPASQTPQLWALYKEVQDYYEKGMRVPEDVTLLLCDDNWGNLRKLPKPGDAERQGGYGIYYHFDYVGGPRNYKWLNTNPLPRIWEQMHLAWQHQVRNIWIVNVGDLKPMEFPISFFLDYAWNPERIGPSDLQSYTESWARHQFGGEHAKLIAELIASYGKFNARRKPELLDAGTFSLAGGEWERVVTDYKILERKAEELNLLLPAEYKHAYFQLVLHPIKACANLYEMYYEVALNKEAYENKWKQANDHAEKAKALYVRDSLITIEYHELNDGKWNHLMSQTHIGYTYWQQPSRQKMPTLLYLTADSSIDKPASEKRNSRKAIVPEEISGNIFYEQSGKGVSIGANNFTRVVNTNGITWTTLPDHGRTGSAITVFPVTAAEVTPGNHSPHLQYDVFTFSEGAFNIHAYFSPTLNYYNSESGLQYAISIDDESPQIISINKDDKTSDRGIWNKWVAENIIIKTSSHRILKPGKHTVKYWMVNPGVVLQKIVLDFGDTEKSYLGPEETRITNQKK